MNFQDRGLWMFCLFPALTMSLGWGLRGFIGGGPLGAMIPGALVAMALCLLLDRDASSSGLIAAFGAIGVGFGGEMTYGQTVGFIIKPETYVWGLAGLTLKGAVWGLLGGAVLGTALVERQFTRTWIAVALASIVAGTYAGWRWINQPKLLYFSDPVNKPRAEIWAGLLLGALLFLACLRLAGDARIPAGFALAGFISGGIGFGLGGTLMSLGMHQPYLQRWNPWWKLMEMVFGFCFGLGLGLFAWRRRKELSAICHERAAERAPRFWLLIAGAAVVVVDLFLVESNVRLRYSYVVAGVLVLAGLLVVRSLAWQVAVAATYTFAAINSAQFYSSVRKLGEPAPAWSLAIATAVVFALLLALRQRQAKPLLRWSYLWLTWACVAVSWAKLLLHPDPAIGVPVEITFTIAALLLTWIVARKPVRQAFVVAAAMCLLIPGMARAQSGSGIRQEWAVELGAAAVGPPAQFPNADAAEAVAVALVTGKIVLLDSNGRVIRTLELDLPTESPVVVGNLQEDGSAAIVAADVAGSVYCFRPDGRRLWKFTRRSHARAYRIPVVADVDGDGKPEVIMTDLRGHLYCLNRNGRLMLEVTAGSYRVGTPSVGDVNGDGRAEIIFGTDHGDVYSINARGELLWATRLEGRFGRSLPLLADTGRDGRYDLYLPSSFVSAKPGLIALDALTGTVLWKAPSVLQSYRSTVAADLDGDGQTEILFSDKNTRIYCVDSRGRQRWSTQVDGQGSFYAPAVADLGGGRRWIFQVIRGAGVNGKSLYVLDSAGKLVEALPLPGGGGASPGLFRFRGDASLRLLAASGDRLVSFSLPQDPAAAKIVWPGLRNDSGGSGFVSSGVRAAPGPAAEAPRPAAPLRKPALGGTNTIPLPRVSGAEYAAVRIRRPDGVLELRLLRGTADAALEAGTPGDYEVSVRWMRAGNQALPETAQFIYTLDPGYKQDALEAATFEEEMNATRRRVPALADLVSRFVAESRAALGRARDSRTVEAFDQARKDRNGLLALARSRAQTAARGRGLLLHQLPNPWTNFRRDEFFATAKPEADAIRVSLLGNEYESAAVVLTNLQPRSVTTRLDVTGFRSGSAAAVPARQVVQLRDVLLVVPDTTGKPTEDPLPLLGESSSVHLAPEESRKLWLTFRSHELSAGSWRATLRLGEPGSTEPPVDVPVEVTVSAVRLPDRFTYRHCNWLILGRLKDEQVRDAVIQDEIEHGANVFVIPPVTARVDAEGKLTGSDTVEHDAWVRRLRPKAFLLVQGPVNVVWPPGSTPTPQAQTKALAGLIPWYAGHMRSLDSGYGDYALYIQDEPGLNGPDAFYDRYVERVKAVKAADPRIQIYANPAGGGRLELLERISDLISIWSPDLHLVKENPDAYNAFFRRGRQYWHYEAAAEQRNLDPLGFYRMQPWMAFRMGMTGGGFWTYTFSNFWFADPNRTEEYGVVYMTDKGPVTTKRWEAARDGIEDFELLWMVREQAQRKASSPAGKAALGLVEEALNFVTAGQEKVSDIGRQTEAYTPDYERWMSYRRRLIETLAQLIQ